MDGRSERRAMGSRPAFLAMFALVVAVGCGGGVPAGTESDTGSTDSPRPTELPGSTPATIGETIILTAIAAELITEAEAATFLGEEPSAFPSGLNLHPAPYIINGCQGFSGTGNWGITLCGVADGRAVMDAARQRAEADPSAVVSVLTDIGDEAWVSRVRNVLGGRTATMAARRGETVVLLLVDHTDKPDVDVVEPMRVLLEAALARI